MQYNVFTPEVKKAGTTHFRFVCHCWQAAGLGEDASRGADVGMGAHLVKGVGGGGGLTRARQTVGPTGVWSTALPPAPSPLPH